MRPTGLKSYDKKTKRAVFEVIVPGTGSRKRVRKVVHVDGWDDLQEKLKAFRDSVQHPDRESAPPTAIPTLHEYKGAQRESYASRLSREKRRSDEAILKLHLLPTTRQHAHRQDHDRTCGGRDRRDEEKDAR